MIKCKNFNSGFTLIELLLAMGILGFLATAAVVVVGNFNRSQSIDIAYDDLQNSIAQTKSYALSQVVQSCDINNLDQNSREELIGYEIRFDTSNGGYSILEVCQPYSSPSVRTTTIITDSLPDKIVFGSAPSSIRFKVLTGGTTLAGDQNIVIRTDDGTRSRTITVTPGGQIIQDE